MLDWIAGYVGRWSGYVGQEVRQLVQWGLHALAGVVYAVFGNVGKAWRWVLQSLQFLDQHAGSFISWVVTHLVHLITVTIPKLAADALAYYRDAVAFASKIYNLALAAIDTAVRTARRWVDDAVKWVTDHVWAPLAALAAQLRADLLRWGYFAYNLLTHPATLATYLLDYLVAAAETAFWRVAQPVGTFALRLILANVQRFAQLAEAIIAAVL